MHGIVVPGNDADRRGRASFDLLKRMVLPLTAWKIASEPWIEGLSPNLREIPLQSVFYGVSLI